MKTGPRALPCLTSAAARDQHPAPIDIWRSRAVVVAFIVAFAGALLVGILQGERIFYGDAGNYWSLATLFTRDGHFSLVTFDSQARGYAFPFAIYGLKALASSLELSASNVTTLFNALLYALIGAVLAPRLSEMVWPRQHWGPMRRLVLTALLLTFWSGDLNYPLSDFPGLATAFLALVAVGHPDSPGWMLTAGAAAAATVDIRSAYVAFLPMFAIMTGLAWFDQRGSEHVTAMRRALCVSLLVIGFIVVSLPQSLTAHRYYGTWSFVPGATLPSYTEQKLTEGIIIQRYDTFAAPRGVAGIFYPDTAGRRLLGEQPGGEITSSGQYLGLFVSDPVEMVSLLTRRIINGLDARYSTVYVEHVDSGGHLWLRIAGFLLVFLALVRVLWGPARRGLGPIKWRYPVALSLCCLTSITTPVETRYMLPVYMLTYMLVLAPGWVNPIGPSERGWRRLASLAVLLAVFAAFTVVVWHVVSGAVGEIPQAGAL